MQEPTDRPQHARRRPPRRHAVPSAEEVRALLAAVRNPDEGLLLALLASAGLRAGEASGLRRDQVHLAGRTACKTAGAHLHLPPRGKRPERRLPVSAAVADGLARALDRPGSTAAPGTFVLADPDDPGRPLTPLVLRRILSSLSHRAGLSRRVLTHDLRRYWVMSMVEAGTAPDVLAALMGHRLSSSTALYCRLQVADAQGDTDEQDGSAVERAADVDERPDDAEGVG